MENINAEVEASICTQQISTKDCRIIAVCVEDKREEIDWSEVQIVPTFFNPTDYAIGKRANGHRNHEAGLLVSGSMLQAPLHHFDKSWNDPDILKHTWKRFATEARKYKEKYGE